MKSRHIVNRIRQAVMTWNIGIFIGLMAVGYLGGITVLPYFRAMLRGPVEFSARQLNNHNGATVHFVQVDGPEIYDTGYEYTSSYYGIQTDHAYYGALVVGTDLLIIESGSPINPEQLSYLGTLETASQAIQTRVIAEIVAEQPELKGVFLPYVLNTRAAYGIWWFVGGILWIGMLGICMWLLLNNTNTLAHPSEHQIMNALSRYGDINEVVPAIEQELFDGDKPLKVEKIKLTQNWLVEDSFGGFDAVKLDSVVWYYKHITQHYYNGIPSGKTIAIYVYDKTGKQVTIKASMKQVDKMLHAIYERTPWAIAGYSEQIKQDWDYQRASLITAVEERKHQAADQAAKAG